MEDTTKGIRDTMDIQSSVGVGAGVEVNGRDSLSDHSLPSPTPQFKIPPVRISSDDCTVHRGRRMEGGKIVDQGVVFYPHKGEYVDIIQVDTVGDMLAASTLVGMGDTRSNGSNTPPTPQQITDNAREAQKALGQICLSLSRRVVGWNWTDNVGNPLPQPYSRPDVLSLLSSDELNYLRQLVEGEAEGTRKNVSLPSASISSLSLSEEAGEGREEPGQGVEEQMTPEMPEVRIEQGIVYHNPLRHSSP